MSYRNGEINEREAICLFVYNNSILDGLRKGTLKINGDPIELNEEILDSIKLNNNMIDGVFKKYGFDKEHEEAYGIFLKAKENALKASPINDKENDINDLCGKFIKYVDEKGLLNKDEIGAVQEIMESISKGVDNEKIKELANENGLPVADIENIIQGLSDVNDKSEAIKSEADRLKSLTLTNKSEDKVKDIDEKGSSEISLGPVLSMTKYGVALSSLAVCSAVFPIAAPICMFLMCKYLLDASGKDLENIKIKTEGKSSEKKKSNEKNNNESKSNEKYNEKSNDNRPNESLLANLILKKIQKQEDQQKLDSNQEELSFSVGGERSYDTPLSYTPILTPESDSSTEPCDGSENLSRNGLNNRGFIDDLTNNEKRLIVGNGSCSVGVSQIEKIKKGGRTM